MPVVIAVFSEIGQKIRLTACKFLIYNAILQGLYPERRVFHAENLSTEETS